MKLIFENAGHLADGIALVTPLLRLPEDGADVTVSVKTVREELVRVTLNDRKAEIVYGSADGTLGGKARFFRALAHLAEALRDGRRELSVEEHPLFETNGAMVDMSRNAVMRPGVVIAMIERMALMGMNTYMLYTEDTYEIPNRPYFGHLRGRYTKDEIRQIDRAARSLGVELVPCIQLLGHLATMLCWNNSWPYRDTASVLLVGEDATYALIGDMLDAAADSFSSKRLHMGMDETHDLGRGASLDKNGYVPPKELYFAHLERVSKMAKERGFEPMMWSDMFFRLAGAGLPGYGDYDLRVVMTDEIKPYLPDGVQPVFWDYYHASEEFYAKNLEKHRMLSDRTVFAGGVWAWSGYAVQFERSRANSVPALEACRKAGTKEIFTTVWHNGSESFPYLGLGGIALYAEYDYRVRSDPAAIDEGLMRTCGVSYASLCAMADADFKNGYGSARAMLYNDPLNGFLDKNVERMGGAEPVDVSAYYRAVSEKLEGVTVPDDFAPALEVIRALSAVLERKADFGLRLKRAYDANDREALRAMADECDAVSELIGKLRTAHRKAWFTYSKPFGFEVFDIRYGGLLMRIDTAKAQIEAYLSGEVERIEELDAPRLRYDCRPDDSDSPMGDSFAWKNYSALATPNIL